MPRQKTTSVALAVVAALGLSTGCEKQNPFITLTAHGVVVKARAAKYCRAADDCRTTPDNPTLFVQAGDTLGIDVPRSVAEQGWRLGDQGDYSHDHYRSVEITNQFQPGATLPLEIFRDAKHGEGVWRFTIKVR